MMVPYFEIPGTSQRLCKQGGSGININQSVHYMYVDRDVTVVATGKEYSVSSGFVNVTYDFVWELKAGWNVIYTYRDLSAQPAKNYRTLGDNDDCYWALR